MEQILRKIRQGEIIRFDDDADWRNADPAPCSGYLMLAAELASQETLTELLQQTNTTPIFSTTRDRLEQMGIFASSFSDTDVGNDGIETSGVEYKRPNERSMSKSLAQAASCFVDLNADHTNVDFTNINVRCVDWGGVINCPRPFEAAVDLCRLAGLAPTAILWRFTPGDAESRVLHEVPTVSIARLIEYRKGRGNVCLPRRGPCTRMPTKYGNFNLQAYEDALTGHLHIALWMGGLQGTVLTRIHSECLTGDLFGSLRCDCGNQLDLALSNIADKGDGILLYLRQEGRGIGLANKLRTYALQDQGFDTIEANEQLGFGADLRDYSVAGQMLDDLGVTKVRLLTNNPLKIHGLESHGIQVDTRAPLIVEPCSDSEAYLDVKRQKMGHLLPESSN